MKRVGLFVIIITFPSFLSAETIFLKDGNVINGTIIEQNEDLILVQTNLGNLSIRKATIDRIDFSKTNIPTEIDRTQKKVNNSAFLFRPLATILSAALGFTDFVFEGQTSFSRFFTINAIAEIGSVEEIFVFALNIGPQINMLGQYLNGPYIGIYPGFSRATDFYDAYTFFTLMFELGYQGVTESGFTWGTYVGLNFIDEMTFKYGIKLGWAFPDPLIKIEQ